MSEALRAPKSFGISGVLGDGCRIYHSAGFSTRDIGRVSDLLAAKLREVDFDEHRLRALILLGAFESQRAQARDSQVRGDTPSDSPVSLECGLDAQRIAVGFSFVLSKSEKLTDLGLEERLKSNTPQGAFEQILCQLYQHSDGVVIRFKLTTRQIEVVCLLNYLMAASGERPISALNLDEESEETPTAQEYVELGDLDYNTLLGANRKIPKGEKDTPSGAIHRVGLKVKDSATVVSASPTEKQETFKVKGSGADADDSEITIENTTEKRRDDLFKIKGGADESSGEYSESLRKYQSKIVELTTEIERLKSEKRLSALDAPAEADAGGGSLKKLLQKLMPGNEKATGPDKVIIESSPQVGIEKIVIKGDSPALEADLPPDEIKKKAVEEKDEEQDLAKISEKLLNQIDSGEFGKEIKRAQSEIDEINGELGSAKARRWVERLLTSLAVEKKNLYDRADKLDAQIRFKEGDFKSRERGLREQINQKEQALRQKTVALSHIKAQLSQLSDTMKGAKTGKSAAADDLKYKQNMAAAQRTIKSAREEAAQLKIKVEEQRVQLTAAIVAQKAKDHSNELNTLKMKHDRAMKQIEELKRINQGLLDKSNDRRGQNGAASPDDMKKRLEGAMKLVTRGKTEAKELQTKLDEAKKEALNLRMETARLSTALKAKTKQLDKEAAQEKAKADQDANAAAVSAPKKGQAA